MTMNPFFEDIVIEMSGQGPTGKTGNSIESIVKTSTDVLTDTYTITFTWGNTSTFEVENGNGIVSITKTGTDVLTDTYTVLFSNETTTTFDVVNGRGISSIAKKSTDVLQDVYEITYNDGTTSDYTVTNGRGITSIEKSGSHDNIDIYTISYNDNTVSTFQVVNGIDGTAATIAVGSTTTGLPGTDASVTNSGTSRDAVFNFVIPRGNTGNGIASIALVGTVGLTKTYRVTYTDGEHFDYQVLDGNGIASIALYSTSGLNKTYRVTYTNGDHFDYVVSDGNGISSITLLSQSGLVKTYRITYTNGTHFDFSVSDGNGIASIEKTGTSGAVDTYTVTFTDPTAEPFSYDVTNGSDTWGAIVGDIADQTDLQTALDNKAPVIVESASGDLVTIADGADLPVESLSVSVEPVQDLHGYDNPWPAGGGANIWDEVWEVGFFDRTTGENQSASTQIRSKNYVDILGNTSYNVVSSKDIWVMFFDSGKNVITDFDPAGVTRYQNVYQYSNQSTITTPSDGAYLRFYTVNSYGATYLHNIAINYPSTVTTYAPYSNICPISGWSQANVTRTGVNLIGFSGRTAYSGSAFYPTNTIDLSTPMYFVGISGSGYYLPNNAPSNVVISDNNSVTCTTTQSYYGVGFNFPVKPNTVYKPSYTLGQDTTTQIAFYTNESKFINYANIGVSTPSFTTPSNAYYAIFVVTGASNVALSASNVQIELGSSATPYQPYQGQQVTIPFGQTVYGGTLDVGAGTMTVDMNIVDLGSLSWTYYTDSRIDAGGYFRANRTYSKAGETKMISSVYPIIHELYGLGNIVSKYGSGIDNLIYQDGSTEGSYIYAIAGTYSGDATAFKTAITGQTLAYSLLPPIVITGLTPAILRTLLSYNAIWADCGAVDVQYRADSKLYVDNAVAEANAVTRKMIADTANGNLAPKSLASGDLIIVGEELRKCTANIGSGSAITDSNSTVANLADVIKALQS